MKFAFTSAALIFAGHAAAFDIFKAASLNCREKPTTKSEVVKVYMMGDDVEIKCQTRGETVMGGNIWDKTQDGCYVLDYYLYTGFSYMFMGECSDSDDESKSDNDDDDDSKSGKDVDDDDDDSESGKDAEDSDSDDGLDSDTNTDEQTTSETETSTETTEESSGEEDDTSGASPLLWRSATTAAAGITAGIILSLF
ncbi:hypothetical protein H4R20_005027 [Coemansia guatemalensis]|uniref:Uncharacterized protein n=1 Tax=Coemansia guatemalensis TaxID=2761395 RepID=A0A9W8HSJ1_9FUNG|nr:hypothetical protein H4R20_005027 [Coemansia guatemalensis]